MDGSAITANGQPFQLGEQQVDPARGLISDASGGESRLEPRVMEVLCALAARQGEVLSRGELIDTIWRVDYGADESLTRAISILRKAIGDARAIETIPKRGYRLVTPVSLVESAPQQAEENGAPAAAKAEEVNEAAPEAVKPVRPPWRVAAAFLGLVIIAVVAVWLLRGEKAVSSAAPNGRVEVRSFALLTDDAETRRLNAGLREALVSVLSAGGVTAEIINSVGRTRNGAPPAELALSGSIDRQGGRLLITANVSKNQSGRVLWSASFERDVAEAVSLRSQVATYMGAALNCALARRAEESQRMSDEVFALFLEVCVNIGTGGEQKAMATLHETARRLVEIAPDLSIVHSLAAASDAFMTWEIWPSEEEKEAYRASARNNAAKALELNQNNGAAYYALAVATPQTLFNWPEIESLLDRVPTSQHIFTYTLLYRARLAREAGRMAEALDWVHRAVVSDPFTPYKTALLAWLLAGDDQMGKAEAEIARAETLWPNSEVLANYRQQITLYYRSLEEAEAAYAERASSPGKWDERFVCEGAFLDARKERTPEKAQAILSACGEGTFAPTLRMLAHIGDLDAAFDFAGRTEYDLPGSRIVFFFPDMKKFREDPRFMPLAQRIGLVDYWLNTDRWPDFCDEPDLPYDCKTAAKAAAAAAVQR